MSDKDEESVDIDEANRLVDGSRSQSNQSKRPGSKKLSERSNSQSSVKPKEKGTKEENKNDDTIAPHKEDEKTEDEESPTSSKTSKKSKNLFC